jgi:hypothetical protein
MTGRLMYVGQGQGWQRNIVMDGSPHLPANIRQWYGDSRGHWEGNTLVIDVTNFSPKTDFMGSRENLHLVEREALPLRPRLLSDNLPRPHNLLKHRNLRDNSTRLLQRRDERNDIFLLVSAQTWIGHVTPALEPTPGSRRTAAMRRGSHLWDGGLPASCKTAEICGYITQTNKKRTSRPALE